MKLTSYNEKLYFLNLNNTGDFLDIRAAGRVEPDENYRSGDIPHGYTLIEYIISGKANVVVGDSVHTISQRDFLFLSPGDELTKYEIQSGQPFSKLWMTLRGRYIDSLTALYNLKQSIAVVNNIKCYPIFKYIIDYITSFGIHELELCHMLLDLFDQCFAPERQKDQLPLADQIMKIIDSHIEKPVRVSDIAGYFCRSTRCIERVFEQKFGVTVYQYLRNRRFSAACRELRQTDELIYVIAERFKLGSPGFFAREFRERFGMTPNEYRQRFKKPELASDSDFTFETIYDYIPYSHPDMLIDPTEKKIIP